MLQKNRIEIVGGDRKRKEGTIIYSCQWRNTSRREQPSPSRQCNHLAESSNDESSDKKRDDGTTWQNLQNHLDRTSREMWRLDSVRYMRWIYPPKVLWQERYFRRFECTKFCALPAIVGPVGLVPSCQRAFGGILRVQIFFSWVFRRSKIVSLGYFVSPKFFFVGISSLQNFWRVFRGFKYFSHGYFVGPKFFSWVFRGYKYFSSGILWVYFFPCGEFRDSKIFSFWLHEKEWQKTEIHIYLSNGVFYS